MVKFLGNLAYTTTSLLDDGVSFFVFDNVAARVGFCFFADAVGEQLTDAVNVVIHRFGVCILGMGVSFLGVWQWFVLWHMIEFICLSF